MLWIFSLLMKIQHHQLIGCYPQHSQAFVICKPFHPRWLYVKTLVQPIKEWLYGYFSSSIQLSIILIDASIASSLSWRILFYFYRHYQTYFQQMILISLKPLSQLRVILTNISQYLLDFIRQLSAQLRGHFRFLLIILGEIGPKRDDWLAGSSHNRDMRAVALNPSSILRAAPAAISIYSAQTFWNAIVLSITLMPERTLSLNHFLINSRYLSKTNPLLNQLSSPGTNLTFDGRFQLFEPFTQGRFVRHFLKAASNLQSSMSLEVAIKGSEIPLCV